MTTKLQPVRGTHDILPGEARKFRHIADAFRATAQCYGYGEITTPIFEFTEVFHRTLGDTSDVVTKETYTFTDRGGESLTLRPEFTAAVVRAFINAGLTQELPQKFFYLGPAFRYERPQKGRLRQFHQVGAELLGSAEPEADVEVIAFAHHFLKSLGLEVGINKQVQLQFNSLGDAASRDKFRTELVKYFSPHREKLSDESKLRLEKNPLRVLDSKDPRDQELINNPGMPTYSSCLSPESEAFKTAVHDGLTALGIEVKANHKLVRGLDYYTHTVFEFVAQDGLGSHNTVLAGGRYDGLVAQMGGADVPGIGFAAGVERLLALMEANNVTFPAKETLVALVPIGDAAEAAAWKLAYHLRTAGIAVDVAYKGNIKKRMARADKIGATAAVMLGEDELARNEVGVKILATGQQTQEPLAGLAAFLKSL